MNYGVYEASKFYYNKPLNSLSKGEIIWLATISKNPNKYNPLKKLKDFNKRFEILTLSLKNNQIISDIEYENIKNTKIVFYNWNKDKLPYVKDFLIKWNYINNSKNITTTIDYNLTQKIQEIANSTIQKMSWKNVWDYSIILRDRKTNDIKVLIWWKDFYNDKNGQVSSILSLRQPWSTLKPFLYLQAFEKLWYKWETSITDLPVSYKTSFWYNYEPKNYSLDYKWQITLAQALSQSINIPSVKILDEIWVDDFLIFLKRLKINSLNKWSDFYGLSIALWSWEVSLYELVRAYSIFYNNWKICDLNIVLSENREKCEKIIEEKYTKMIEDILSNRYIKLVWFPINSNLDFEDKFVFVKTWTSRNFKDNWSIWYTKNYIIWVWVWNKDWSEMKWVSWSTWAWDIFRKIVYLIENEKYEPNTIKIEKENKIFLEITSPLNWNIFQIDNTIPIDKQKIKLKFETNIKYDNYIWILNWEEIKWDFIDLIKMKNKNILEIILYKSWNIINKKEIFVWVE